MLLVIRPLLGGGEAEGEEPVSEMVRESLCDCQHVCACVFVRVCVYVCVCMYVCVCYLFWVVGVTSSYHHSAALLAGSTLRHQTPVCLQVTQLWETNLITHFTVCVCDCSSYSLSG